MHQCQLYFSIQAPPDNFITKQVVDQTHFNYRSQIFAEMIRRVFLSSGAGGNQARRPLFEPRSVTDEMKRTY